MHKLVQKIRRFHVMGLANSATKFLRKANLELLRNTSNIWQILKNRMSICLQSNATVLYYEPFCISNRPYAWLKKLSPQIIQKEIKFSSFCVFRNLRSNNLWVFLKLSRRPGCPFTWCQKIQLIQVKTEQASGVSSHLRQAFDHALSISARSKNIKTSMF